jgi:hypothetical protein
MLIVLHHLKNKHLEFYVASSQQREADNCTESADEYGSSVASCLDID